MKSSIVQHGYVVTRLVNLEATESQPSVPTCILWILGLNNISCEIILAYAHQI